MLDFHMHSSISFDSESDMRDMIAAAHAAGIRELCFTEHLDIPPEGVDPIPLPDLDRYDANHAEATAFGAELGVHVGKGIEIGPTQLTYRRFAPYLERLKPDFVICSQHFIVDSDPYDGTYFNGKTQKEAYSLYLSEILATLRAYHDYNVVGHIGYVTKYWPVPHERPLVYADYADILDAIFAQVISDGRGIEVNTSGVAPTGDFLPPFDVLRRYRELGGEIVTVGSDSHTPDRAGQHIAAALERLRQCGFRYVCAFRGREPRFERF